MFFVIRNGEYLESEKLLFGDFQVPPKPHNKAVFINNEWVINADTYLSELDKTEAIAFLQDTDWKIVRHKEQQDLGIETSLTEDEYLELITQRQEKRILLNNPE